MLQLHHEGRYVVNVDESWIGECDFTRLIWCKNKYNSSMKEKPVKPRLSLLAALDSEGNVWFALSHSNTDVDIMRIFSEYLCKSLDGERADWRGTGVWLMDGAKYHTCRENQETLKRLGVPTIFTGPNSYTSSPVEKLFAGIKSGDLNPTNEPLSKK